MDDTRDEREQSEKLRAEQFAKYGCDLCPTDENCRECQDAYNSEAGGNGGNPALEQKVAHEHQWDKELDRKLKEKNS
jgi:hypothetical protein